jgi:hypothetical protein
MEAVAAAAAGGQLAAATVMESNKRKEDHRQLPRSSRRKFQHDLALECIERDYIGDTPLLGVEFKLMFRLSQGCFQVLMEDVMASDIKFFKLTGRDGRRKSSLAARLLLPLKTLAYGVPPPVCALDPFDCDVQQPADLQIVQNAPAGERRTVIGINNAPPTVQAAVTRSDRFRELNDLAENRRLHMALMTNFNT